MSNVVALGLCAVMLSVALLYPTEKEEVIVEEQEVKYVTTNMKVPVLSTNQIASFDSPIVQRTHVSVRSEKKAKDVPSIEWIKTDGDDKLVNLAKDQTKLSLESEHYAMPIPYDLTRGEIGGYSIGGSGKMADDTIAAKLSEAHLFGYEGTLEHLKGEMKGSPNSLYIMSKSTYDKTGVATYKGRYLCALGKYFFPDGKRYYDYSVVCMGQCFDIILEDDTVVPCIYIDAKNSAHTNGGNGSYYRFSEIKKPEYRNLFQAYSGDVFEFMGSSPQSVCNLRDKLKVQDGNPPKEVVIYKMMYKEL